MPNKINSFVFLDFETGGLDCTKNAVTEIAAIAIKGDTLEKIDLVSTFVKPYGDYTYEPEALKSTGITFEDIESGVTIQEAVKQVIELLDKSNLHPHSKGTQPILFAHNSKFDKGFLIQIFNYCKKLKELEKLTYGDKDFYGNYQPEMFDTQILAKMIWGADEDMTSIKLTNCIVKLGLDLNDAHKAINDTIGLKDMVALLINKLRSTGEVTEGRTKQRFRNHFQF